MLVVSGGSNAGLQTGQRYFVRRLTRSRADEGLPATIHTAGWIQIMGVDTSVATANIVHACDGILLDDYLEPFVEPRIAAKPLSGAVPQYENMGHIVTGVEGLHTGGAGNVMAIDRGTTDNIAVGQRFLIFRQKRDDVIELSGKSAAFAAASKEPPLVEIGEALVISARPNDATVQITVAKTAITTGDLVAPITVPRDSPRGSEGNGRWRMNPPPTANAERRTRNRNPEFFRKLLSAAARLTGRVRLSRESC